jgi:hypothetical protein
LFLATILPESSSVEYIVDYYGWGSEKNTTIGVTIVRSSNRNTSSSKVEVLECLLAAASVQIYSV